MTPIDFSRLEAHSKKINEASDDLTKALTTINEKLNSLNLGLQVFLEEELHSESTRARDQSRSEILWHLGYGKVDGTWGLLLKTEEFINVDDAYNRQLAHEEQYLLLSCPRELRIKAVEFIPSLIQQLERESENFTKSVSKAKE